VTPQVRAFVAIELPAHVRETLAGLARSLESENIEGLRTVRPEAIHLTLRFLGDVPASRIASIEAALRGAVEDQPGFSLELSGVGVFPERGAPRVLWAGLAGDLAGLATLHTRVEETLEPLGFPAERRLFHPHLTVARIRDRAPSTDRLRARDALSSADIGRTGPMRVEAVSLMQSILRREGAEYRRLASIPLDLQRSQRTE
jgi:2'-5' RNA ligase